MPVITRKEGESFMVSDDIVITVVEARSGVDSH
jgi:sRNA-binding carbon storage regulator CsrA